MFTKKIELYEKIPEKTIFQALFSLFVQFRDAKAELYLVGGCTRDLLLGKAPKDYDLCTNLTPDQVKELLVKDNKLAELEADLEDGEEFTDYHYSFIDTGLKHGTITVHDRWNDQFFEITTYRIDGKYEDGRHPTEVVFTPSLEEDLKRRDFTVNSFAYNLLTHEVLALDESYFKDLEYGIIRAVGDPAERYKEDALRMLRALRFSAQLNFSIEKNTYHALSMCAPLISKVSKERIRDELTKILLSDNPQVLELFAITGLEKYALDELTPIGDIVSCPHQNPWHYTDVFHHTMDVVKRVPKTFELRWAALFHDFGKPAVKELKEGTTDHYHYHGHQVVSVELALKLMDMLKFSNEQRDLVYKFVKYHDDDLAYCRNGTFKRVLADIGIDNFLDFMKLKLADAFAHRLSMDTKWAIDAPDKIYERYDAIIKESQAITVRDLDINGYDLMDLGLSGKQVGDCLNYLLEEVLEDASVNKNEILKEKALQFKENML